MRRVTIRSTSRAGATPRAVARHGPAYILVAPVVGYLILVLGYPVLLAFYFSISSATTAGTSYEFVGLGNFRDILQNSTFRQALSNTVLFTLASELVKFLLAAPLALLLFQRFRGRSVVRGLVLLPWILPLPLAVIAWRWLLDPNYSAINWLLTRSGIMDVPIPWLGDPWHARASVIGVYAWRDFPFIALMLLAGLTSIPEEVIEAAKLDGAGLWARVRFIIAPLLKPILFVAVLFSTVLAFTSFSVVYLLTKGGPIDSTHVIATLAFDIGIRSGDLGRGAAMAVFMFPVLGLLVAGMLRLLRSE